MPEPDQDRRARARAWFVLREARAAGIQLRRDPGRPQIFNIFFPPSMPYDCQKQFTNAMNGCWHEILEILTRQQ